MSLKAEVEALKYRPEGRYARIGAMLVEGSADIAVTTGNGVFMLRCTNAYPYAAPRATHIFGAFDTYTDACMYLIDLVNELMG